jgi:hypothetical protein
MKARMKVEKPEDIEATITITMRLSEWEALRDQLVAKYPSWKLSGVIDDLLSQGRKIFWSDPKHDEAA